MTPRAQAKRRQIATAARTLFLADGYSRTSMDAVTAAAGVSKQTLYAYFPAKEELLVEVISEEIAGLAIPGEPPRIRSKDELRATLLRISIALTSRLMTDEAIALLRLLIGEASHVPLIREFFYDAVPARILGVAISLLTAADAEGVVRVPRPDLSARLFLGPLMTFVALDGWLSSQSPRVPSPEDLSLVIDAFLRSLEEERSV